MKRITAFVLLIMTVALTFVSCTAPIETNTEINQTPTYTSELSPTEPPLTDDTIPTATYSPDAKNKTFAASSQNGYIYKNMYFYDKNSLEIIDGEFIFRAIIKYHNMDDINEDGHNVFPDSCSDENNAFTRNNIKLIQGITVDIDATEKNGGIPVLCFSCIIDGSSNYCFASYNMADDSMIIIGDNTDEYSSSFYLYGDTIYYTISAESKSGAKTIKMRSIKKDGTDPKEYPVEFGNVYPTFSFYNDKAYYTTDTVSYPYLYVTDINFEECEKLLKINNPAHYPKIRNGYVYYTESSRTTVVEGNACGLYSIYRRSLDNFEESSPELIVENVYDYFMGGSKIVYWTDYDLIKIQGTHFEYFEPYVLRCYDTLAEKSKTLITAPKNEDSVFIVYRAYTDYILFYSGITKEENEQKHYSLNLNTGKLKEFIDK